MSAGAATPDDITSFDWSLELDSSTPTGLPGSGIGNVVQGVQDINQAILIILTTPQGSDPLRPTFGCDLLHWIDTPVNVATPGLVAAIVAAITLWEPRVRLLSVVINLNGLSQLMVALTWQLKVDTGGVRTQKLALTVPRNLG